MNRSLEVSIACRTCFPSGGGNREEQGGNLKFLMAHFLGTNQKTTPTQCGVVFCIYIYLSLSPLVGGNTWDMFPFNSYLNFSVCSTFFFQANFGILNLSGIFRDFWKFRFKTRFLLSIRVLMTYQVVVSYFTKVLTTFAPNLGGT